MYFRDNNTTKDQDVMAEETENIFDESEETEGDGIQDDNALLETFLVDQVSNMSDADRKAYLESDEFNALVEAGVIGRRSIVRMNKQDDLQRRIHLASIQKAREVGDADWEALRKNRINERRLLNKIYMKYSNRVRRDAVQSQKRIIKLSPRAFDVTRAVR